MVLFRKDKPKHEFYGCDIMTNNQILHRENYWKFCVRATASIPFLYNDNSQQNSSHDTFTGDRQEGRWKGCTCDNSLQLLMQYL